MLKKRSTPQRQLWRKQHKERLLKRVEAIIPRDDLGYALQRITEDDKMRQLAELLLSPDPKIVRCSLRTLAIRVGLTYMDVVDGFRRAKIGEGLMRMYQHVPDVLEHTATDAKTTIRACNVCRGLGSVKKGRMCEKCSGTGQLVKKGDADDRKLIFEAAGLTGKRGPLIAQQFNIQGDTVEKTITDAHALLNPAPDDAA